MNWKIYFFLGTTVPPEVVDDTTKLVLSGQKELNDSLKLEGWTISLNTNSSFLIKTNAHFLKHGWNKVIAVSTKQVSIYILAQHINKEPEISVSIHKR